MAGILEDSRLSDYQALLKLLGRVRAKAKTVILCEGLLFTFVLVTSSVLVLCLMDNLLHLPGALRLFISFSVATATLISLVLTIVHFVQSWSSERVARKIEYVYPELENRLINAVQLGKTAAGSFSSMLINSVISDALRCTSRLNLNEIASKKKLRLYTIVFLVAGFLFGMYPIFLPDHFNNAARRILSPVKYIPALSKTALEVHPGDVTISSGDSLEVTATLKGTLPGTVLMYVRENGNVSSIEMIFDGKEFRFTKESVTRPFTYRVEAGDAKTAWYSVNVIEKPRIIKISLTYAFPEYTLLAPQRIDLSDGNIRAVYGTKVVVEAIANKPLMNAQIMFENGDSIVPELEKTTLQDQDNKLPATVINATIPVIRTTSYQILITDEHTSSNDPAPRYSMVCLDDIPPTIVITSPDGDVEAESTTSLPVFFTASDDFGIAHITAAATHNSHTRTVKEYQIKPPPREVYEGYTLDLSSYSPGDLVTLQMAAKDTDIYVGGNLSYSNKITIRIVEHTVEEPSDSTLSQKEFEKLKNLYERNEEFKEVQKKVIDATKELAKVDPDQFTEEDLEQLEDIKATEDDWAKFFKDAASDLSKLPAIKSADTALIENVIEIYSEIEKIPEELRKDTVEMNVSEEQIGLELAEELTAELEKWLPDEPDHVKWNLEEPEIPQTDVPLADLPDELEDIIGDLIEQEEDMTEDIEDLSSSYMDSLDKGAGWGAADGPISNYSAQGVTGNIQPNSSEIGGRAGEGRSGRSHGEFVEKTAVGKPGGRKTPTRLTDDPFEESVVDDRMTEPTSGATGGGKQSGAGGEGLLGPLPPELQNNLQRLARKQADILNGAIQLNETLERYKFPSHHVSNAVAAMQQMQSALGNFRYQNLMPLQQRIVTDLKQGDILVKEKLEIMKDKSSVYRNFQLDLSRGIDEAFIEGYEELLEAYYKKLSTSTH